MVTAFILGLGQIEIETINESVSFQKNESWQLCTGSAFWGEEDEEQPKGWGSPLQRGLGRLNMC